MFKQLALVTLADPSPAGRARARTSLTAVAGAVRVATGDGLPGSADGGDLVWHLHFADEAAWRASDAWDRLEALARDPDVVRVDAAAYRPEPVRVTRPALRDGVYRALMVRVEAFATEAQRRRWLAELRAMPDHIPEIVNAATGIAVRARGDRGWSHVWEQEFATIADLRGPYLASPYHWGHVDRWFDPEMPERIVDTRLCHSASTLEASVMADYR